MGLRALDATVTRTKAEPLTGTTLLTIGPPKAPQDCAANDLADDSFRNHVITEPVFHRRLGQIREALGSILHGPPRTSETAAIELF